MERGALLLAEDFGRAEAGVLPPGWWFEGGEEVRVADGRLWVRADSPSREPPGNVCTVWWGQSLAGDIQVEVDAHVTGSHLEANNINLFVHYADPAGESLMRTRAARASGAYPLYHELNGYIFTFLNDWRREGEAASDGTPQARIRMRRCPGFELIAETYAYHCRQGTTYHLAARAAGHELMFAVDGNVLLKGHVEAPWDHGLLGLRTFQTELWWDNVRVARA